MVEVPQDTVARTLADGLAAKLLEIVNAIEVDIALMADPDASEEVRHYALSAHSRRMTCLHEIRDQVGRALISRGPPGDARRGQLMESAEVKYLG